jgi:hypothetical protein
MLSTEPVAFEIQAMPRQDHEFNPEYEISLANIPNVRVFAATLTDQDLVEFYQRSYVVVLPYDPKVYEYRGSAIMQEAIAYTRPVGAWQALPTLTRSGAIRTVMFAAISKRWLQLSLSARRFRPRNGTGA